MIVKNDQGEPQGIMLNIHVELPVTLIPQMTEDEYKQQRAVMAHGVIQQLAQLLDGDINELRFQHNIEFKSADSRIVLP